MYDRQNRLTFRRDQAVNRPTQMTAAQIEPKSQCDAIVQNSHVVFLVNFISPNHFPVLQEVAKRCGKLTILCSVKMESNRDFDPQWGDLEVVLQKTWTLSRTAHHPSGYHDVNYIHIPLDTVGQLRALRPDAVVSFELGGNGVFMVAPLTSSTLCTGGRDRCVGAQ